MFALHKNYFYISILLLSSLPLISEEDPYIFIDSNAQKMVQVLIENKDLFSKDREGFEKKWNDIKVIIEYGMLSEEKFFDKAQKFALYPTISGDYFTFEELKDKISKTQTDKDGNLIILYASNKNEQHSYIEAAKEKGYEVLLLDSPIISHLIQKIETSNEKVKFSRVDADVIDKIIKKENEEVSKLDDKQKEKLKTIIEGIVPKDKYTVQLEAMDSSSAPFIITLPEFMRRMKEMQQSGGNGMFGNMPEMYNLIVNVNNTINTEILNSKSKNKKERLIKQSLDLARLSQNLLKGEELTSFIKRSIELIK